MIALISIILGINAIFALFYFVLMISPGEESPAIIGLVLNLAAVVMGIIVLCNL